MVGIGTVRSSGAPSPTARPFLGLKLPLALALTGSWTMMVWFSLRGSLQLALAASSTGGSDSMSSMPGMPRMASMPGMSGVEHHPSSLIGLPGLPMWVAMIVAMMLPGAFPAIQHVSDNSLRWRRGRAVTTFTAAYLLVWSAFGTLALALVGWWGPSTNLSFGIVLCAAAAWQLSPSKRRALQRCHRSTALPATGWAATRGVLRFGLANGSACVSSCWLMMLVMLLAPAFQLVCMVGLTAVVSAEKLVQRPRHVTRHAGAALAATALLLVVVVAA
jgi:predicted metal-binding membrane protein